MPSPFATAGKLFRRFRRNRQGSAMVEFALVAPVFFALLFAIIEVALVFYASQVLETVTQDTARQIFTGQAQLSAMTAAQFKSSLCGRVVALFDCPTGISIDVQSYSSFSALNISDPIDPATKNFVSPNNYSPGGPGDIVVVRVFYQWPLLVTGMGFNLSNLAGSKRLLTATAAFQNEPY
jgi:Flp pilus assembly protein TadG